MNKYPKYKYLLAINDVLVIFVSFLFAAVLTSKMKSGMQTDVLFYNPGMIILFFVLSLTSVVIFQSNNLYKINIFLTIAAQITAIVRSLFLGGIFVIVLTFIAKIDVLLHSRFFIVNVLLFSFVLLILSRVIFLRKIYSILSKNKIIKRNVIIIGAGNTAKLLSAKLFVEDSLGINIVGFLDDNINKGDFVINGLKVLGKIDELHKIVKRQRINEAIIAIDNITYERILEILDLCHKSKIHAKIHSELFSIVSDKIETEKYSDISIINVTPQLPNGILLFSKTVIDFLGASAGIIILSPLFILIAILIKLSSPGPVFYAQMRIGKNGKPFRFYKFRSMYVVNEDDALRKKAMIDFMKNNEKQDGADSKIVNQSRITKIGSILRKTSLDELPQLINVLIGDMSLVGPRPCIPYEYENYDEWQKRRNIVAPGCTGVWQVYGRSQVSFKDSVVLDIYYINNMSPWLDMQLILKTIPVMVFGKGGK